MKKSLYTIRKKKHAGHPQVIVDVNKTKFKSMSLTHGNKNKNTKRLIPLIKNPNVEDKEKAYLSKRIIEDFKFNFSKAFKNYKLTNADIEEIIKFLKSRQK